VKSRAFVAFDLGASGGRTVLGRLGNERLNLEVANRFSNSMMPIRGHLHWDIFALYKSMKEGLSRCRALLGAVPDSMAVDTWGVDFGLLARDGSVLGLPFGYRDNRTEGMMERFFTRIPKETVYRLTGIQFLPFNTLFQLYAMATERSPLLEAAADLLFMPDLFNYLFTGEKRTEFTFATTSQLYNPVEKTWEETLLEEVGVSPDLMQEIASPGTILGGLSNEVAEELGLDTIPLVACASHDTGSAVAAVPAEGSGWAYISSGTWSLMGLELREPLLNRRAMELNFTNEGGVDGTFRFLKNISGLWLLQECRRIWSREKAVSYEELIQAARSAPPFQAVLNPDDSLFLNPADMVAAIRGYCTGTGQNFPLKQGGIVRTILESLALKYRETLMQLKELCQEEISRIHIIGGGVQNSLLCQFTADATGLPVMAGPVEATAIGNIMVQARAMGEVDSMEAIRSMVRRSFPVETYLPRNAEAWAEAFNRFLNLTRQAGA
jgi:rhamnulokinase